MQTAASSSPASSRQQVHVRWAIRRDLAEMLHIERQCFDVPWTADDFTRCLRQRHIIGMVAELPDCGKIVGYMVYEIADKHIRLMSLAVHPDYQRHGVGAQLIRKLQSKLSYNRRVRIFTEVRERNLAAQKFFQQMKFRALRVLRDFYSEDLPPEDAFLFQFRLPVLPPEAVVRMQSVS